MVWVFIPSHENRFLKITFLLTLKKIQKSIKLKLAVTLPLRNITPLRFFKHFCIHTAMQTQFLLLNQNFIISAF